MMRKLTALVAAAALAATVVAPAASARDYHRGHGYYGHGYYGHGYGRYHHGDAVAVGAFGLVLGLALGSAIANSNNYDRGGCSDECRYQGPPSQYQGYDPGRGGPPPPSARDGSAYEDDYGIDPKLDGGPDAQSCTHQERQWDRYANRYVTVDVPC